MRKLRERTGTTGVAGSCWLSPLAKAGSVELVDGGNKSSSRSACRLTGKGREFAKLH